MAQAADDGAGNGAPFAKFGTLGNVLIGAYAGGKPRQRTNFDTKAPMFKDDGRPLQELLMHFVAMPGTTAGTGDLENLTPIEAGAHVRFAVSGFKWGQVIDQRKALPSYAGFAAGVPCSGDVYTISLVGWSVTTDNPQAAATAGFTVVEKRIVLRSEEDRNKYVLKKLAQGGNTNVGKDYEISIRRPTPDEKRWEQLADELFATRPWEKALATVGVTAEHDEDEPF